MCYFNYSYDICFTNHDTGYLASYGILKTTDKGNTWQPDTCNYYSTVSKIHFANKDIGYALASASGGTALMKRDPDIGVTLPEKNKPGLFQVYPIPARERITVSFFLSEEQSCTIDLLDQFGRIVKSLSGNKNNLTYRKIRTPHSSAFSETGSHP